VNQKTKNGRKTDQITTKLAPVGFNPTLALLPFANISAAPSIAYLPDDITDSLFF